jgi:predicted transposase YdaD
MAKTYDAVLKHLVEAYPAAWLKGLGFPTTAPVRVIDADVPTVTAAADKVFWVEETPPWLMHLELQADPDMDVLDRTHLYSTVLRRRHRIPVRSAIVLLRREADSPRFTGMLEHLDPAGDWERRWRYQVVRVWQLPVESLLTGGLGLLPLALVTDEAKDQLPEVVRRMDLRLRVEAAPDERKTLWTTAFLLMGLRHPPGMAAELLKGVCEMEESSTYQWIIEKGIEKGIERGGKKVLKETLIDLGAVRFGRPDATVVAALNSVENMERLTRMRHRLLDATDWDDLLGTP